jgi:hypothetical protein
LGILIGSNYGHPTLKKPNAIIQSLCAEIEDKRFYDYSPEFIADQKSEDYRIIYGLAEYNFWSDDKQSDGFIRRDAAKK